MGSHRLCLNARQGDEHLSKIIEWRIARKSPFSSPELKYNPHWSSNGESIIYSQLNPKTNVDLNLLSLSGEKKSTSFIQSHSIEGQPRFSPNGKWIAYISNETSQFEVYVEIAFSYRREGGDLNRWRFTTAMARRRARALLLRPDRKMMAVK